MGFAFFGAMTSVVALFVLRGDKTMRKVDKLGRIVIPKELRDKYGLLEGADINFEDNGNGIVVKADSVCRICNRSISKDSFFPLCKNCITTIKKHNDNNSAGATEQ